MSKKQAISQSFYHKIVKKWPKFKIIVTSNSEKNKYYTTFKIKKWPKIDLKISKNCQNSKKLAKIRVKILPKIVKNGKKSAKNCPKKFKKMAP